MATIYTSYRYWCAQQEYKIRETINLSVPQNTIEGIFNSAAFSFAVNIIYYRGQVKSGLQAGLLAISGKLIQYTMQYLLKNRFQPEIQFLISSNIGASIAPLAGKVLPIPVACKETLQLSGLSFFTFVWLSKDTLPAFPLIVMMKRA